MAGKGQKRKNRRGAGKTDVCRARPAPRIEPPNAEAPPTLSLCMILRDGAATLSRAIESVRAIVDEVVVVDTGSTDAGPEIARVAGAKLAHVPWADDFASARNAAVDRASGDWVLVLDADEAVAPADLETLRRALRQRDVAGYRMPSRNYTDQSHGSGFKHCSGEYPEFERDPAGAGIPGWYPTYKVRLFRRTPEIRFRGRVHEMVDEAILESGGRIADLAAPVHHYGVLDPDHRAEKGRRYLRLGEAKVEEAPDDARAWFELGVQAFETGDPDRSRTAFARTLAILRRGPGNTVERSQALGFRPDLAHVMLGVIAERKGEAARAAEAYRAALKMNPRSYEAHMNWGILLESRGKPEAARNHFQRATEVLPRDPRSRECLSRVRGRIARAASGRPETSKAPPAGPPTISLCMIVKDEEETLGRCLESVEGLVSEMIVVDTGSSDGTRDAARRHGATVIETGWSDDFSAARNRGLDRASGDWILVLDADEEIAPEDRRALVDLVRGGADAYRLITRNYVSSGSFGHLRPVRPEAPMARGAVGWFPSDKTRLFRRRPEIRFEGAVHEVVDPAIERLGWTVAEAPIPIHHYGHLREDEARKRRKRERYLRLAEKKAEGGCDPKAFYEIGVHAGETGDHEGAVRALSRALGLAPDFHARYPKLTNPCALIGANLLRLDRPREAAEALEKGIRLVPDNVDILHFLGLARNALGRTEEAVAALRKALSIHPGLAAAHRNLGVVLRDAGRPDEARGHFEKALSLDPGMSEVREYLGRMDSGCGLSLCMIVRNEAGNLEECLKGVRDIADEMIVVDTGSDDGTPEVARRLGARVFTFAWRDDFSAARNESLRRATGDYVLWLDADDRLDEENRGALRALKDTLPPGRDAAFTFILSNRRDGREMDRCRQMRLFPRLEGIAFEGRIHEQVTYALRRLGVRTEEADVRVDHLGYPDIEGLRQKAKRNVRLMRMEAEERPDNWANRFHLACALALLEDLEGAHRENLWVVDESRCRAESPEWYFNALLHLSRLRRSRGDLDGALAALDRAAELRAEDGFLLFSRGELLLAADRPADAHRALAEAEGRPIGPGVFPLPTQEIRFLTRLYRAQAAERCGRAAEAEALYRALCEEDPERGDVMRRLAGLLLGQGRAAEAQPLYERALERNGRDAALWCNLGICRAQRGQADPAEACFQKALELDEDLTAAWANLGRLYREEGKAEPAALALSRAAALDPRHLGARLGLAALFVEAGEVLEAVRCGLSVLEILGLDGPEALEDWSDVLRVFEAAGRCFRGAARRAEAALADRVLEALNAFTPPEEEASAGNTAAPAWASDPIPQAAGPRAPEKAGAVPGGRSRIEADFR